MDDEIPRGVPGDPEDSIAECAASIDEALAAGLDAGQLSAESADGLSTLLAAHAALQELERVWPRSPTRKRSEPKSPESSPAVFGQFEIVRELGQGGFGIVFLAYDTRLGRRVALENPAR